MEKSETKRSFSMPLIAGFGIVVLPLARKLLSSKIPLPLCLDFSTKMPKEISGFFSFSDQLQAQSLRWPNKALVWDALTRAPQLYR